MKCCFYRASQGILSNTETTDPCLGLAFYGTVQVVVLGAVWTSRNLLCHKVSNAWQCPCGMAVPLCVGCASAVQLGSVTCCCIPLWLLWQHLEVPPCVVADVDGLITQALLTGNFESAVDLCLHDNRMADAIILAIAGGQELLSRTQEKYFAKMRSKITRVCVSGQK